MTLKYLHSISSTPFLLFTLLQKKKKNLMMISFYIQFGVQFPLH